MNRLKKGLYGSQRRPRSRLFGLRCGQISARSEKVVHNGGWYNSAGEKLGWGDLSVQDIGRISRGLRKGELFIVLGERDSYWNFVSFKPEFRTSRKEKAPGIRYVIDRCYLIVARSRIYYVTSLDDESGKSMRLGGLTCRIITKQEARTLVRQARQTQRS